MKTKMAEGMTEMEAEAEAVARTEAESEAGAPALAANSVAPAHNTKTGPSMTPERRSSRPSKP